MIKTILRKVKEKMKNSRNPIIARIYIKTQKDNPKFHYTPITKIAEDTKEWSKTLSSDFDCVIAIPRSGLIVGSIIATLFGKPLSTPDQYILGNQWISSKGDHRDKIYNTVLLIDDSTGTGSQMKKNKELLQKHFPDLIIKTGALYSCKEHLEGIDHYFKTISILEANQFEFNIMHTKPGPIALDLDGVLCEEYPLSHNYIEWMKEAKPYKIPLYEIDCIITARSELYKEITEEWLKKHSVKYKRLYMLPLNNTFTIDFKTRILLKEKPYVYLESNKQLSEIYAKRTGIRVICLENGEYYSG
jgi:hypoxanthine phosphoribosyltransferase